MKFRRILPVRSINVREYKSYGKYKDQLRKDFNCRCGYCDADDKFIGGKKVFHIDHFAPKAKFPELKTTYKNLVYSCPSCNSSKSNYWASDSAEVWIVDQQGMIDPCSDMLDTFLSRDDDGKIYPNPDAKSNLGGFIIGKLNLDLPRHSLIWKLQLLDEKIGLIKGEIEHLAEDEKLSYVLLCQEYKNTFDYVCEINNE